MGLHPGASRLTSKGGSKFPEKVDLPYRAFCKDRGCAIAPVLYNLTLQEIAERGWWPCGTRPERAGVEFAHVVRTWGASGEDRGVGVGLCPAHHDEQEGRTKQMVAKYGVDLYELAQANQVEYEEAERGA